MARRKDYSAVNKLVKYFLFFENFIVWLGGLVITALGSIVLYMKQKAIRDAFDFFLDPAMLMVTAGSIVVFITFFGCMGSLRENTCCLKTFNYILGIIFLGELTIVVIVFVFYFVPDSRETLGLFPKDSMQDAIRKYGVVDDEDMVNLIDNIQRTLGCCGLSNSEEGYLDWNENLYFNCTKSNTSPEKCSVPASCCIIKPNEANNILCGKGVMQSNNEGKVVAGPYVSNIYQPGCLYALGDWINSNAMVLGGVLLGILLPQVFRSCSGCSDCSLTLTSKSRGKEFCVKGGEVRESYQEPSFTKPTLYELNQFRKVPEPSHLPCQILKKAQIYQ